MKKIKIGFDIDGVIVAGPPFVPKSLLEYLVRSHQTKRLAYRFPKSKIERFIRWLSHHPFFRPAIKKNIKLIKNLAQNKDYQLYIISSRYSFLVGRTKQWFAFHRIDGYFKRIILNRQNVQPHLFKEKEIKRLALDFFIEDDPFLAKYLRQRIKNTKIIHPDEDLKFFLT